MRTAVIVTIAGGEGQGDTESLASRGSCARPVLGSPIAFWDVLGRSVLARTLDRLRESGVTDISVLAEEAGARFTLAEDAYSESTQSGGFWPAWDSVVSRCLAQGVEMLLLARIGTYAEFNLAELVHFHRETASSLTQVCDSRGPLDLLLVDGDDLRRGAGSYRRRLSRMIAGRRRFRFSGYSRRLTSPADYRYLVQDALLGRCELRPTGREIQPGVWLGSGAKLGNSVTVTGPAYIGSEARVQDGVIICGESNIEHATEIDCGTVVDGCSVLPHTYVGVGLHLSNVLVAGAKLFHLQRNIEMEIGDRRLIGGRERAFGRRPHRLVRRATSLISWPSRATRLSTRADGMASSMPTRLLEERG